MNPAGYNKDRAALFVVCGCRHKGGAVNQELRNAVTAAEKEAQYDASAKRLLGNKKILAHILVRTVEEFKGMDPNEVCGCIEGE